MNPESASTAGLPIWALLPAVALVMLVAVYQARRSRSAPAAFLIIAVGLRTVLAALHVYTYSASPLGLSWNALASVAVCAGGLLVLRRRPGLGRIILPLAPILSVMALSATANQDFGHATGALIKFVYFGVLAVIACQAADDVGAPRLMGLLLPVALAPLAFQLLALPLGITKAGENDGSASFIGGFNHEAAYSVLLVTAVLVTCFADRVRLSVRLALLLWCIAGLIAANYRTSILGAAPLVAVTLLLALTRTFVPGQRKLAGAFVAAVVALGLTGVAVTSHERFVDLGVVWERGSDIIQPPTTLSTEDRRLMSGRPALWSKYIYAWADGEAWQTVVGFGPESWSGVMDIYAHNTLVSALYEVGVAGTIAMLILWGSFISMAALAPAGVRGKLVAAHLSFVLLNMATMPMWMIEGMILYALLCGVTAHYAALSRRERQVNVSPRPLALHGRGYRAGVLER
jgi:hypothetical protein